MNKANHGQTAKYFKRVTLNSTEFQEKEFENITVKLLEMHIKRERTHGKEGIFKDEKYKHKGYEEPAVFCIFIG